MTRFGAIFTLQKDEIEELEKKIKKFPNVAESAINRYLREEGKKNLIEGIELFTPISDRKKTHAKTSKPYTNVNGNLSVTIKSKKSFRYLYFPNAGAGTSKFNPKSMDYMEEGVESSYNRIINGLLREIEKEL